MGAALLAAASVTAASSVTAPEGKAPSPSKHDVANADLILAAASSPLNIPVNIAIDVINIPQYEVDALNYEAAAFFFTGSWWVSDATNVWGTDPGDPPKYIGAADLLLPNPWLSAPVGATLSAIATAELPVNSTCGTTLCPPLVPFDTQGAIAAFFGLKPFPIVNDFFTVPLSDLYTGYTFDPTAPGQQSFGGYVPTDPFGPGYDLPGTQDGPNGTYLMPWAGQTVNLTDVTNDAWTAYVNHLEADPAQNPITIPTGQDLGRALTNLVASGIVDFDPFTPGMSYCPSCEWPKPITPEGIVGALSDADPGNTLLKAWLDNHGWQASQGAPGTPATPSTPGSVAQQQKSGQAELKTALQKPASGSQMPASTGTSSVPQQQSRPARPGPSSGVAGVTRAFAKLVSNADNKATVGGKNDIHKTGNSGTSHATKSGRSGHK